MTISAQGDGTLSGAVYGIYRNGELVDTYTTDENGYFKTKEYVCGNYTVQEISPSEGYLLDETMYPVGAETENYSIEHNPISMTVTEDVLKGKISIIKHSDDGSTQIETPEVGAEFEVYLKSSGSYEAANDSEKDYLVCDENGYAQTKMLPYGIYVVHQIKGLENTEQMEDFEVNISENEKEYFYLLNDAVKKTFVKIVKKGAETGNIIPVSGIGFKVWDCANSEYVSQEINYPSEMILNTFYTDESGSLMLPNELVYGDYELHEVQSAEGYVLDKNPVPFTIDGSVETVVVEKTNTAQKGKISVQKTGNVFASVTALGSAIYIDENGEVHESGQTTYTPVFAKGNLSGAVFQVIASEDIITLDGSVIPADGLISEISLAENMSAKFDTALPFGKYYVQEIATDEHYVLNGKKYLVNFEYMGQEVTTVTVDCGEFKNALKRGKISGKKVDENEKSLENALFGLFAVDTAEFTADNAYMTDVSDENGHFEFDKIPYGEYIVREIEAPTGYILSDESYPVTISEDGEIIEIIAVNKPITVEISKQDVYGNELAGAEMQLENSDGEVVDKWTSDGTNHVVTELPAGGYTLKEIAAPDGYVIATDIRFTVDVYGKITVENVDATAVSENGNPLIVMVDDTTKVKISKRDITTDKELAGATLQIIDEDGNVATEWVSTDEAHFIEGKLIAGKEYTLRETIAPDGYEIASEIKFTVNTDGSVTEVVMYDEHTPELEIPPTVTIDTPNTGVSADNSAEFYLVAAAVVVAFGMVICKRNDKEKRKDDVK